LYLGHGEEAIMENLERYRNEVGGPTIHKGKKDAFKIVLA